jgi:hypothetical protein
MTNIVWNGCDGYIESEKSVFTATEEFKSFKVIEIERKSIELDDEGDLILDGIFLLDSGRFYKNV